MPHWPPSYPATGKIIEILELLDNPHRRLPPIIHVTGTNGKGSVISFLKQIFIEHGLTTHVFTSPHLLKFNENFIISNNPIEDGMIYELTEEIRNKLNNIINPSFFEYQTALAFLAFSRVKADICIIECGMGAMNDPTNILTHKLLSIITPITFDHEEYLGNRLELIAGHKAHIMNNSEINIISPQTSIVNELLLNYGKLIAQERSPKVDELVEGGKPDIYDGISRIIQNKNVISYEADYDFDIDNNQLAYVDIAREDISYYNLPSMQGDHQITNLVTALAAIKNQPMIKCDDNSINRAIVKTSWPGRIENLTHLVSTDLPNGSEIWFDGAHNEAGAYALSNWIRSQPNTQESTTKVDRLMQGKKPDISGSVNRFTENKKNIIVYGRSENKDHNKFLRHLNHQGNKIIFVTVKNEPLPETRYNFQKFLEENSDYDIDIYDSLEYVFFDYLSKQKSSLRVIICGSLYLYRDLHTIKHLI